jgi:branched-chain amino acid transport system permease protein
VDVLVQGALTSATIALVALGFSLVYGVGGIVNLAHGSFFMIGAYAAFAMTEADAPLLLAVIVGVAAAGVSGLLLNQLVLKQLKHQNVALLIATLSAAVLIDSVVRYIYGAQDRRLPGFADGATDIFGVQVLSTRVVAGVVATITIVIVLAVLRYTPVGRMVRAVAEDAEAATLVGVRPDRVTLYVVVIGAALAGLAGVMAAPYGVVNPTMWLLPLTQAFAIVILGGLGSINGTILAAIIVGFLDRFVAFTFNNGEIYVGLITIAVILGTLVLRPSGLLGKEVAH